MQAGFLGLGRLGKAMAQRLIAEGVELTVWNRSRKKTRDLQAQLAESPADLISKTSLVFVNVLDSAAVRQVLTGPSGLLEGECAGKVIVDTTTNHFAMVPQFYSACRDHGAQYLEAPVSGSVVPAQQGKLAAFVSGERAAYEEALPYLQKLTASVQYFEHPQLATVMKLINNGVLASFMAALAEAIVLGEKVGLTREQVIDGLAAGAGNSGVLAGKREKLLHEDWTPHFPAGLLYRDAGYVQDLAGELRQPMFMTSAAHELFGLVCQRDLADQDFSAIYQALRAP